MTDLIHFGREVKRAAIVPAILASDPASYFVAFGRCIPILKAGDEKIDVQIQRPSSGNESEL